MTTKFLSTFLWEDYLVFAIMLAISSAIGLFFGFRNLRKKNVSSDEMLTGGRELPVLPVALSLSASFTSATTILGIPAEVYTRGGEQWLWCFGIIPCFIIVAVWIVPVFYRLELTNAYEYLEIRFNRAIRTMGSLLFLIIILTYMAAVLYAPSVALSQVTGLSREVSVLTMGLVCTFYTSIGGIRAVVWTDAFQLLVVWVGLLAVMIKGAADVGGWSKVWETARQGDRLPRFDMNPDPFVRHTFWTLLVGGCMNMMTVYGANQTNLQRYSSVKTLRGAQGALLLCLPLWVFYLTVLCLLGLVMYAYFLICDPLTSQTVTKKDQLVPLFVLETMGAWPGLPGLFVASIFSASISTVSSGVNSLAAVTLEDVIRPLYRLNSKTLSKRCASICTVILGIIYGCVTIVLAYLADFLSKTALVISFSVFGMIGGPLLGLILNGIFLPWVNTWGAGAGLITSLAACLYAGIDPVFNPPPKSGLPLRTDGCLAQNLTADLTEDPYSSVIMTTTGASNVTLGSGNEGGDSPHLYLSYMHYATLAVIVSLVVGAIVSLFTGCNKRQGLDSRTVINYPCCSTDHMSPSSYDIGSDDSFSSPQTSVTNGYMVKSKKPVDAETGVFVSSSSIRKSESLHKNKLYNNI